MAALLINYAAYSWLRLLLLLHAILHLVVGSFAPYHNWHLIMHSWEVAGRVCGGLKNLAVGRSLDWVHTFVETVGIELIAIIIRLVLLAL